MYKKDKSNCYKKRREYGKIAACLHPAITGAQDGLDHLQIVLVVARKLLGMLEWIVG